MNVRLCVSMLYCDEMAVYALLRTIVGAVVAVVLRRHHKGARVQITFSSAENGPFKTARDSIHG